MNQRTDPRALASGVGHRIPQEERPARLSSPTRPVPPALVTKSEGAFACAGMADCTQRVSVRNSRCPRCAVEAPRLIRQQSLAMAYESVSPNGSRREIRAGTSLYEQTTQRLRAAIPAAARDTRMSPDEARALERLVVEASWNRDVGGILILGPTGIGKSKLLVAMAQGILDRAMASTNPADITLAKGVRYVNGLLLAERQRDQWETGRGMVREVMEAERASVLFFDEIGYESELRLVRRILRARYDEREWMPTIAASNATLKELNQWYGENLIRTIWGNGLLIDLGRAA